MAADELARLADGVLMPCFDGLSAPEWLLRRTSGSLGGVCLFARNIGSPEQVSALTAELRARRADLVIAIDEEAGDVTRLDAATGSRFPGAAALGRADDASLTEEIGYQVGSLLRDAGITLNFAPSADVAVDSTNPVIGTRAFGDDAALVARHTAAFIVGHQAAGTHACVKHFPGHGDTAADSHTAVAVVGTDLAGLETVALPPFRAAIKQDVSCVMAGHLVVPAVDDLAASVSRRWLSEILREEMGFDGVVVTDALEMAAINRTYGIAEGAVMALNAGADLLCLGGEDAGERMLDEVQTAIVSAVRGGRLGLDRLRDAVARVRRLAVGPAGAADRIVNPLASSAVAAGALRIEGPLPRLTGTVLAVRCDDATNLAVGDIPWGLAAATRGEHAARPDGWPSDVREIGLRPGEPLPQDVIRAADTVLVLTRDIHRHDWMAVVLQQVRALAPAAVLVEMGNAGLGTVAAPAIASFGASVANARAVLAALGSATDPSQS